MKLFKFIVSSLLLICLNAGAQNARIEALGGCFIIPDMSNIIGYPAHLNRYANQVQGTAYTVNSFGPVIGIKGFGEVVNIGLLANTIGSSGSSILRGNFYSTGKTALTNFGGNNLKNAFPPFPHVLVGLDLDNFLLGFDVYVEGARYKFSREDSSGADTEQLAQILNGGLRANATFELGAFTLSPLFGFGIPYISGENKTASATTKARSRKKISVTLGARADFDLSNFPLSSGIFLTNETYSFKIDTVKSPIFRNTFLDLYCGFNKTFGEDLLLASQYSLTIVRETEEDKDLDTKLKNIKRLHALRLGFEAPIEGFWIFDTMVPRAGFVLSFSDSVYRYESNSNDDFAYLQATVDQVALTAGMGITKNIVGLDLNVELGNWEGVFIGPRAASATLTIDFSNLVSIRSESDDEEDEEDDEEEAEEETKKESSAEEEVVQDSSAAEESFDF